MTTKAIAECDRVEHGAPTRCYELGENRAHFRLRFYTSLRPLPFSSPSLSPSLIFVFFPPSTCATFRYSTLLSRFFAAQTRWRYMMVFGHILEKMVSLLAANVIEISLWYGKLRLRWLLLLLFRLFCSVAVWLGGRRTAPHWVSREPRGSTRLLNCRTLHTDGVHMLCTRSGRCTRFMRCLRLPPCPFRFENYVIAFAHTLFIVGFDSFSALSELDGVAKCHDRNGKQICYRFISLAKYHLAAVLRPDHDESSVWGI